MQPPPDTGPTNKQAPLYNPSGMCAGCAAEHGAPPTVMDACAACARPIEAGAPKVIGASGSTYCSTNCMLNKEGAKYVP